jgi:hypothetical protein
MNGFDEVVREGFDARLEAITEAGGVPRKRARSVLHAIRLRRAVRAGTATGASILTVAAIAVGAMALRPAGPVSPGVAVSPPSADPLPTSGPYSWCDLASYPAVNPGALANFPYEGRIYQDTVAGTYTYVGPDGSHTTIEPGADGSLMARTPDGHTVSAFAPQAGVRDWRYMALDYDDSGNAGARPYWLVPGDPYWGGRPSDVGPGLLYEWTTTVPAIAPAGVSEHILLGIELMSIGSGLGAFDASAILAPEGATVDQVVTRTDGTTVVTPITVDALPGPIADPTGVASVSVRVTGLPDGGVYEITSTYDPSKTWTAACGNWPSSAVPAPVVPKVNWGPYFLGPEQAEFQCLATLPTRDKDVISVSAETGVGPFSTTVDWGRKTDPADLRQQVIEGDYGTGGAAISVTLDLSPVPLTPPDALPGYPGWDITWESRDGVTAVGGILFGGLAWVDADGTIIGREVATEAAQHNLADGASFDSYANLGTIDGRDKIVTVRKNLATAGVPCDGVDPAALAAATVVWVQGVGPDPDRMTWSWTRVWSPTTN